MKKSPESKAGRGKPPGHPPRKRRLKTLDDLRRYLSDVVARLEEGQLDDAGSKTRAYLVNILSSVVKDSDLETRLEALEQAAREERKR